MAFLTDTMALEAFQSQLGQTPDAHWDVSVSYANASAQNYIIAAFKRHGLSPADAASWWRASEFNHGILSYLLIPLAKAHSSDARPGVTDDLKRYLDELDAAVAADADELLGVTGSPGGGLLAARAAQGFARDVFRKKSPAWPEPATTGRVPAPRPDYLTDADGNLILDADGNPIILD